MDEATGELGGQEPDAPDSWRFSIEVATGWEKSLFAANTPCTRKIALRSAMVMSPERGGTFDILLRLVRLGLGGASGSGKQFISWIHEHDFVRALDYLIAHDEFEGPINVASPNPLPNQDFMRILRKAEVDAGNRGVLSSHRNGANPEEPARCSRAFAGERVRVSVPAVALRCGGLGPELASTEPS